MKHPLLGSEILARGKGPSGVTYTTDVVLRYARIIALRTGGDSRAVKQHFTQLIGKEQAAKLGFNVDKLKVSDRSVPDGGSMVDIRLRDQEALAIAAYLVSPDHLNLGDLPPNPFGSPIVADVMDRMKALRQRAQYAPEHLYTRSGGPTADDLQDRVEKLADTVAYELGRAMPSNEARAAALKALRLDNCLEVYAPQVIHQTGWHSIQVRETVTATGQRVPVTKRIAVYKTIPGGPDISTRYRVRPGKKAAGWLLNLYDT
jgi:hypothetical protein